MSAEPSTSVPVNVMTLATSSVTVTDCVFATGASFTATKFMVTVDTDEDRSPSEAVTVKVLAPFSWAAGT